VRQKKSGEPFQAHRSFYEQIAQQELVAAAATTTAVATAAAAASATTAAAIAAATAAATIAAAAAATTATAAAATSAFTWAGLVDDQGTAIDVAAIDRGDRLLRFIFACHLNETEATGLARIAVGDDLCAGDVAGFREEVIKLLVRRLIAQITDVKFGCHGSMAPFE
jgi:hypothetical protein